MKNSFFIIGAEGSGSTSLATILNLANDIDCKIEPAPNLQIETRQVMDGRDIDKAGVIASKIVERVTNRDADAIYGEKRVTLGPFIQELYEQTNCKFIFVYRDGRDVVRSSMDWNNQKLGTIYRECQFNNDVTEQAVLNASGLPIELDYSDYSRPRPKTERKIFREWRKLSREAMLAFYWAEINRIHQDALINLPKEAWISINYTTPSVEAIRLIFDFLGSGGLDENDIQQQLEARMKSLNDEGCGSNTFPNWQNWNSTQRTDFSRIANKQMLNLGFYQPGDSIWKPKSFGAVWNQTEDVEAWYSWMYKGRIKSHQAFIKWVRSKQDIASIADFGSGVGFGYRDELRDFNYTGYDISAKVCEIANLNAKTPNHKFICLDYIAEDLQERYDLVYSSGTIDNCYDVELYIEKMVCASREWIYFSCYRGWFPQLEEHRYAYNPEHHCFYNDLSPDLLQSTLKKLNCTDIKIYKQESSNKEINFETVVFAKVPIKTNEKDKVAYQKLNHGK